MGCRPPVSDRRVGGGASQQILAVPTLAQQSKDMEQQRRSEWGRRETKTFGFHLCLIVLGILWPGANGSCDMVISSSASKNGTIVSPNYPNPYPAGIKCTYHFQGEGKERVQIKFTDFDLFKSTDDSRDCENVDSVVVFITIKGQRERVDNFCGNTLPVQIMSNEHRMTVIFQSHATPTQPVKGFRAIYQFVTNFGIPSGRQDPQNVCQFVYNSSEVSNGTFTTPNYPGVYPRDTECHYLFYGKDKEKIHIQFAYFDVEGVPPCTSDTASDYVEFSNFKTVDRKMPRHCGNMKPNRIESDSDFFRVAFRSNDKFDGTGFEAFYQFRGVHADDPKPRPPSHSTGRTSSAPGRQAASLSVRVAAAAAAVMLWRVLLTSLLCSNGGTQQPAVAGASFFVQAARS